jgi:hypothetical protein
MPLLGERLLPDSVNTKRRQVRSRLEEVRRPLKNKRKSLSPVDVIGMTENNLADIRDRFVQRNSVVDRIRERRSDSSGGSDSGSDDGNSGNGQEPSTVMT